MKDRTLKDIVEAIKEDYPSFVTVGIIEKYAKGTKFSFDEIMKELFKH